MDIKEILSKVAEFQNATDQLVSQEPILCENSICKLRFDLMEEENIEYLAACSEADLVEVLDACVDQLYILAGTINSHGLQNVIVEAFKRVHLNNLQKVGPNGKVLRNSDGKILKPQGFVPVSLFDLIKK
jgi:predicted HAD superfamily Cof-like phosphohydrolase